MKPPLASPRSSKSLIRDWSVTATSVFGKAWRCVGKVRFSRIMKSVRLMLNANQRPSAFWVTSPASLLFSLTPLDYVIVWWGAGQDFVMRFDLGRIWKVLTWLTKHSSIPPFATSIAPPGIWYTSKDPTFNCIKEGLKSHTFTADSKHVSTTTGLFVRRFCYPPISPKWIFLGRTISQGASHAIERIGFGSLKICRSCLHRKSDRMCCSAAAPSWICHEPPGKHMA